MCAEPAGQTPGPERAPTRSDRLLSRTAETACWNSDLPQGLLPSSCGCLASECDCASSGSRPQQAGGAPSTSHGAEAGPTALASDPFPASDDEPLGSTTSEKDSALPAGGDALPATLNEAKNESEYLRSYIILLEARVEVLEELLAARGQV